MSEILQDYPSECFMSAMILFYLIVISIYTGRFHDTLTAIKATQVRMELKIINQLEHDDRILKLQNHLSTQKKLSYQIFGLGALFHLILTLLNLWNLLQFLVPMLLFLFVLYGNYWLKGRGVLSVVPDQPDTNGPFH